MIRSATKSSGKPSVPKRFLIGQLGSYGDCLYATTIARQIKTDFPDCYLTWAIGTIYRSILNGNPYIDEIWEIPISTTEGIITCWQKFEDEAIKRKERGDFDEVFFTQVYPNNLKYFDGTTRSSMLRSYGKPITVPVSPVLHLSTEEIEKVRNFAESHHLKDKKHVILFECSPKSGQSFVTPEFAGEFARRITDTNEEICVILSSNEPFKSMNERIIDGSVVSFRENAELTKYCTLLIGSSSGISWICTSDWAKPLQMVQLLSEELCMYASFVHDHEYHGLSTDSIIEMTKCSVDDLIQCVDLIFTESFETARQKYHERIKINFRQYAGAIYTLLLQGKYRDAITSIRYATNRYEFPRTNLVKCSWSIFTHPFFLLYKVISGKPIHGLRIFIQT